jgi:hypothetical protein
MATTRNRSINDAAKDLGLVATRKTRRTRNAYGETVDEDEPVGWRFCYAGTGVSNDPIVGHLASQHYY